MDTILTVKEVAQFFDKKADAIYGWIRQGWISPIVIQLGKSKRYQFTVDILVDFYKGQVSRAEIEQRIAAIRASKKTSTCKWEIDGTGGGK